jgi:arsenite-transporting ATPase
MQDTVVKKLFFLGKGGTGKTTLASLVSLAMAEAGKKTAIFSIDPAHNLFDIFRISSSKSSFKLRENLFIEEIDIEFWIKTYLKSIEDKISRSYQHLTALSLEKHLQTIRYSPGLEEYALQYAFEAVINKYKNYDYLLFDMPPTALALRFFNLPKLTMIWLEELINLRRILLEKKNIIENVQNKHQNKSGDKVLDKLTEMKDSNLDIISNFQDDKSTEIFIVLNEDQLSLAESEDIYDQLTNHNFCVGGILINKYQSVANLQNIKQKFSQLPQYIIPYNKSPQIGEKNLLTFLRDEQFKPFLDFVLK